MKVSTKRGIAAAAVAAALTAPLIAQGATAQASVAPASVTGPGLHWVKTLSKSLVAPLQLAVNGNSVYVGDAAQSILRKVGGPTLVHGPNPKNGGDISGVAVNPSNGDIAYTSTNANSHSYTTLTVLRHGKPYKVTNLARYEKLANPDKYVVYGIPDPAKNKCATAAYVKATHGPARYTGQVDSHPYAIAYIRGGAWAVADAGGNDIVRVGPKGFATRIAVLPRQKFTVNAAFVKANKLPACTLGLVFYNEPVPTDVERGPDGNLYVTTLPGGPDGPGVSPSGSVYKIDMKTHKVTLIATGFSGATNLALTRRGAIYVAELGAGRLSTIVNGRPKTVFKATGLVGVETANGKVYVSTAAAVLGVNKPGHVWVLEPNS